ncbi:DNA cytosine methyltransferase [Pseudidiomarina terrestris]|uniref:DNA cytosine methyltransferase n=1 Tax=Pseudidiomarina terrestris TaxID=2820060 RepID=UPI0026500C55|nr:DNA cytosine methyltransferase [Pseudidiomarina sp. 1ASP75-5]MDN7135982.1 DNA cytosine methyltransferase [Pseudidiomarina sp. 1ASP75-5]
MSSVATPIIDLFAGPGGLGEGFSSTGNFNIVASAEMDPIAHKTLTLRAFFRILREQAPERLADYYAFCNGDADTPYTEQSLPYWEEAEAEALCVELGTSEGNRTLDEAIVKNLPKDEPWILIGGPPCQAYSLAGRSRNKGKLDYKPEEDKRHFLYREYLRIIQENGPALFVMENVKGILSSRVNGERIFHSILRDLSAPFELDKNGEASGHEYIICSLVTGTCFKKGDDPTKLDPKDFVIQAEDYGIPQKRHRVILLGIRSDLFSGSVPRLQGQPQVNVRDVISDLPQLRSRISRTADNIEEWKKTIQRNVGAVASYMTKKGGEAFRPLSDYCVRSLNALAAHNLDNGSNQLQRKLWNVDKVLYKKWFYDNSLDVILNHEARSHMESDLTRYFYASCFAEVFGRSPKGPADFWVPQLAPTHSNWQSGNFSDRFRVQLSNEPATTITSHISKDGHYYIHPDPKQCRSLTVREAARIQTFPDNYFFQGNRTQQYHQVGNAVPPMLARMIAESILELDLLAKR